MPLPAETLPACKNPECRVLRQALDAAVARAEQLHKALRMAAVEADAIVCVEADTRHDLGLPPKEDE
jgi:hypothetical protein